MTPSSPTQATISSTANGVGLSNPEFSQGRRQQLDLVNRLRATGVDVHIDIPRIAVIGSQSAGKSSLIESFSGVGLPRASGTCTRCPIECLLSYSTTPWKCIVSLVVVENDKPRQEQFGNEILDKSQVEDRIRRAQRAILSPTIRKQQGAKFFLNDESDDFELTFSREFVKLQISGPDVADLSFCDLPGLIAGVGTGGNAEDIEVIKDLIISYISRKSTIILLTVACETDFQNQGAHELAKSYDPQGERTIGVLTKPDRIPEGEELNWVGLLRNEREALENGWFCVKQPSSQDLKNQITWDKARNQERDFFSRDIWAELDSTHQKHLGTRNLVERLSAVLSDLISKRLPEIQSELENAILHTKEALSDLPKEPPKDPLTEVNILLHGFLRDLSRHVDGVPDINGLLQVIRPEQEVFRRAIRRTAPDFLPFERGYAKTKTLEQPEFLSSEEEVRVEEAVNADEQPRPSFSPTRPVVHTSPRPLDPLDGQICIDEVLLRAHRARTRELPGNYPFVVQQTYIKAFIAKWSVPAHTLRIVVYKALETHLDGLISTHFRAFGQGMLEQRAKVIIHNHLGQCSDRAEERIDWLLELEDQPFTLNHHYLSDYKAKFLTFYKGAREKDRNSQFTNAITSYQPSDQITLSHGISPTHTRISNILAGLAEVGVHGTKPEDLAKLIPPDGMEPALNIMADVRAYFQVAYKRFVDNVPLAIDRELVRGVEHNVLNALYSGLHINEPEGRQLCAEMAQESSIIASRREELKKKLGRLQDASKELLKMA